MPPRASIDLRSARFKSGKHVSLKINRTSFPYESLDVPKHAHLALDVVDGSAGLHSGRRHWNANIITVSSVIVSIVGGVSDPMSTPSISRGDGSPPESADCPARTGPSCWKSAGI